MACGSCNKIQNQYKTVILSSEPVDHGLKSLSGKHAIPEQAEDLQNFWDIGQMPCEAYVNTKSPPNVRAKHTLHISIMHHGWLLTHSIMRENILKTFICYTGTIQPTTFQTNPDLLQAWL